jgi:hypothetical protein
MKTLRPLVITTLVLYVVWSLLPQIEWRWLSEDAIVVSSYAGLESVLGLEVWMSWVLFGITVAVIAGMVVFGIKWRLPFLCFFAFAILVIAPLSGMNVETGISIALRDATNILIGAIVALSFQLEDPEAKNTVSRRND